MKKMSKNKVILYVDQKYGRALKKLAREELKRFHSIPLDVDDLYNCFLFIVPDVMEKIEGSESKRFNSIKLYARRFYFNKCRHYITKKYVVLNQAGSTPDRISDVQKNRSDPIDITTLNYKERIIYQAMILDKNPIKEVGVKLNVSYSTARKLTNNFKLKLKRLLYLN